MTLQDLRDLAAKGDLTVGVQARELRERRALLQTLVGTLYPQILSQEIVEIEDLPARAMNVFDQILGD